MTGQEAIRYVVEFCRSVARDYVNDLGDKDLMVRAVPGANHIAWCIIPEREHLTRTPRRQRTGDDFFVAP